MYVIINLMISDSNTNKFKDNVTDAFKSLFHELETLFDEVDFTTFKNVCMLSGSSLPQEYKKQIEGAQEFSKILNVLDNPLYANWCKVDLLKTIAKNIPHQQALHLIQVYEDTVYSRKASDVQSDFAYCFNEKVISLIEARMKTEKSLTVLEVIDYCEELRNKKNMKIYKSLQGTAKYINLHVFVPVLDSIIILLLISSIITLKEYSVFLTITTYF